MLITDTKGRLSLAHLLGWTSAHFRPGMSQKGWRTAVGGDGQGFPDLILVRAINCSGRIIYAELKMKGKKPTPEQRRWLDLLYDAGEEVYLWMPEDTEEIAEILHVGQDLLPGRTKFLSSWGNRR